MLYSSDRVPRKLAVAFFHGGASFPSPLGLFLNVGFLGGVPQLGYLNKYRSNDIIGRYRYRYRYRYRG